MTDRPDQMWASSPTPASSSTGPATWRAYALAMAMTFGAGVVLLAAGSRTSDDRDAAGIFPPWWSPAQVMAAASQAGTIRDLGAVPFIVTIRAPDGQARERLRRAGALFAVAPAGSAACAS